MQGVAHQSISVQDEKINRQCPGGYSEGNGKAAIGDVKVENTETTEPQIDHSDVDRRSPLPKARIKLTSFSTPKLSTDVNSNSKPALEVEDAHRTSKSIDCADLINSSVLSQSDLSANLVDLPSECGPESIDRSRSNEVSIDQSQSRSNSIDRVPAIEGDSLGSREKTNADSTNRLARVRRSARQIESPVNSDRSAMASRIEDNAAARSRLFPHLVFGNTTTLGSTVLSRDHYRGIFDVAAAKPAEMIAANGDGEEAKICVANFSGNIARERRDGECAFSESDLISGKSNGIDACYRTRPTAGEAHCEVGEMPKISPRFPSPHRLRSNSTNQSTRQSANNVYSVARTVFHAPEDPDAGPRTMVTMKANSTSTEATTAATLIAMHHELTPRFLPPHSKSSPSKDSTSPNHLVNGRGGDRSHSSNHSSPDEKREFHSQNPLAHFGLHQAVVSDRCLSVSSVTMGTTANVISKQPYHKSDTDHQELSSITGHSHAPATGSLTSRMTTSTQTTQTERNSSPVFGEPTASGKIVEATTSTIISPLSRPTLTSSNATATATAVAIGGYPVRCEDLMNRQTSPASHQNQLDEQRRGALAAALRDCGSPPSLSQYPALRGPSSEATTTDSDPSRRDSLSRMATTARLCRPTSVQRQQSYGYQSSASLKHSSASVVDQLPPFNSRPVAINSDSASKRSSSGSSAGSGGGGGRQVQVEVAVVGAPVVFGQESIFEPSSMNKTPPAMKDDERIIERCEAPLRNATDRPVAIKRCETVSGYAQLAHRHMLEAQKRLSVDIGHARTVQKPDDFVDAKVRPTSKGLLSPVSPTETTAASSANGTPPQIQPQHPSPGAESSSSSSTDQQPLVSSVGYRRRGSFSSSMQPPKKRFMQSIEDHGSVLTLDDEAPRLGSVPSKNFSPMQSPVHRSPTTPQKIATSQSQSAHQGDSKTSYDRPSPSQRSSLGDSPHQQHGPSSVAELGFPHYSAFIRSGGVSLNTVLANQQQPQQHHSQSPSGHGAIHPTPITVALPTPSTPKQQRRTSLDAMVAFEMSQFLYGQSQQQPLRMSNIAGGAILPSTSAGPGSLTNGLPTSLASSATIQHRLLLDPSALHPLSTAANAQTVAAIAATGAKWPPQTMGSGIAGLGGLMPALRPSASNGGPLAASNVQMNPSPSSADVPTTAAPGVVQYNLMQEIKNLPQGEQFQLSLNNWEWCTVDGVRLPCIYRGAEKFVAVHMVQMRLLSKFPPNVPGEIMRRHTMVSHKMNVMEAWIFNTLNALECKYDFGYQLFTPNDEVVKVLDVEKFYWAVKAFNLNRMGDLYRTEIRVTSSLHLVLTAHISSLKGQAETEARAVQALLMAPQTQAQVQAQVQAANFAAGRLPTIQQSLPPPSAPALQPVPQHRHPSAMVAAAAAAAAAHGSNVLSPPPGFHAVGGGVVPRGPLVGSPTAAATTGLLAAAGGYHPSSATAAAAAAAHAAAQQAAAYEAALAQGALLAHPSPYAAVAAAAAAAAAIQPPPYPSAAISQQHQQHHHHHPHLLATAPYGSRLSPSAAAAAAAAAVAALPPGHHSAASRAALDAQALRLPYAPRHGGMLPRY